MSGISLDAGALIALERGDADVRALLREAVELIHHSLVLLRREQP